MRKTIQLTALSLSLAGIVGLFAGCSAPPERAVTQTPAFGEPVSTIPWNQPQKWEGGGAGLNALRNGEEN